MKSLLHWCDCRNSSSQGVGRQDVAPSRPAGPGPTFGRNRRPRRIGGPAGRPLLMRRRFSMSVCCAKNEHQANILTARPPQPGCHSPPPLSTNTYVQSLTPSSFRRAPYQNRSRRALKRRRRQEAVQGRSSMPGSIAGWAAVGMHVPCGGQEAAGFPNAIYRVWGPFMAGKTSDRPWTEGFATGSTAASGIIP